MKRQKFHLSCYVLKSLNLIVVFLLFKTRQYGEMTYPDTKLRIMYSSKYVLELINLSSCNENMLSLNWFVFDISSNVTSYICLHHPRRSF